MDKHHNLFIVERKIVFLFTKCHEVSIIIPNFGVQQKNYFGIYFELTNASLRKCIKQIFLE